MWAEKKKSGLRWFEPVESLVVKPSAVTKIKTALWRMQGWMCAHARTSVRVCEAHHVTPRTPEFFF